MATLTPQEILYEEQHIHDDRRPMVAAANATFLAITVIAVALRFWSRRLARTPFGLDDLMILLAEVIFVFYVAVAFILTNLGMGRHLITVTDPRAFVIWTMVAEACYAAVVLCFKLAILLFYLRVFPQKWFRGIVITTGAFQTAVVICFIIIVIFQCVPIDAQWIPEKLPTATCVNYPVVILVGGILNTIVTIYILLMPMPLLYRLKIEASRKRLIMLMFLVGVMECVAAVVRLQYVHSFKGVDATWGNIPTVVATSCELGIGILCACIPTYRPLYTFLFHHSRFVSYWNSNGSNSKTAGVTPGSNGPNKNNFSNPTDGSATLAGSQLSNNSRSHTRGFSGTKIGAKAGKGGGGSGWGKWAPKSGHHSAGYLRSVGDEDVAGEEGEEMKHLKAMAAERGEIVVMQEMRRSVSDREESRSISRGGDREGAKRHIEGAMV